MPRPPRIHVDDSLYHAEKTKNKNQKPKNEKTKNEKRVKSFVVKSLRGNKRKRITKDGTPMADGRGLLHRPFSSRFLAHSKQRPRGGVLALRFSLHGDPGRGDLERRRGERERMKDESGRMNRQSRRA
jgi:hypothetical protein